MIRMLVAAPTSGSGKTAVTCALLTALRRRGLRTAAFKCGPDYIDPMFHRAVLGVESCNLDLFLSGEETARRLFAAHTAGYDAAVCEGAMGYYDGVGGVTDRASAWHVAQTLALPTVLVLRAKGASLTLAAQIRGLCAFRAESRIAAVILNDCSPMLCRTLAPMLERETGVPVLGCLPHLPQAEIASRHLGLYTAQEIRDLTARISLLADALEEHTDLERLLALCEDGTQSAPITETKTWDAAVSIAVARDEAFCFSYAESIEVLQRQGAEIAWFSPMHDAALPQGASALYLPGGYPELYAQALARNTGMRGQIRAAIAGGMPTVAECGGFLYLGRTLRDRAQKAWEMVGALPGEGFPTEKLVRFGYGTLHAAQDSLLFRAGEEVPVHEFHYWDSTENGCELHMVKPVSGRSWSCGFVSPTMYAAFPHLYFAGRPELAARFVAAAQRYRKGMEAI